MKLFNQYLMNVFNQAKKKHRKTDPISISQSDLLSPIAEVQSPEESDGQNGSQNMFDFTVSAFDLRDSAGSLMRDTRMRHSVMGLLHKIDEK